MKTVVTVLSLMVISTPAMARSPKAVICGIEVAYVATAARGASISQAIEDTKFDEPTLGKAKVTTCSLGTNAVVVVEYANKSKNAALIFE